MARLFKGKMKMGKTIWASIISIFFE